MEKEPKHRLTEPDSIDVCGAVLTTVQAKCACCVSTRVHRTAATFDEHEVKIELECSDCQRKSLIRVYEDGNGHSFVQVAPVDSEELIRQRLEAQNT